MNNGVISAIFISLSLNLFAQSTFETVTKIFGDNCSSSACHGKDAVHPLKLEGTLDEIYDNLIDVEPKNPFALSADNKLVVPGNPTKSFLYRKINNKLYSVDKLSEEEGQTMPITQQLSDIDKETIRQWILWGAPKAVMVHKSEIIKEFYEGGGLDRIEAPELPDKNDGFQIYFGTIFLDAKEEIEIMKKIELPLGDSLEIIGFDVRMNEFSHHYALSRLLGEANDENSSGINIVDNFISAFDFFNKSEFITGAQKAQNTYTLPENIAFRWDGKQTILLNYHIKNYSSSGILPAEAYINLFTQAKGKAKKEMKSKTLNYGNANGSVFDLQIKGGGNDTTFVMEHFDKESDEILEIWRLTPHTHQLGVDYDVFKRNEDGTKGEQVYEGFYNYEMDFNQGFFDYSHATYRSFEEPLLIKMSEGLIFEATYNNPTSETVNFGLKTDDEMFVGYYLYTKLAPEEVESGIFSNHLEPLQLQVYPNPVFEKLYISALKQGNAAISIYNINGKKVYEEKMNKISDTFNIDLMHLNNGTYWIEVIQNKEKRHGAKILKL